MRKNIITLFILITLAFTTMAVYANNDIKVVLNGEKLVFDVPPTTIQNRTMVPVRKIFESLGAKVSWDEATGTVTGTKGDKTIIMKIDSTNATVNGASIILDVPATVIDDRTLVPIRFISESLGLKVNWVEDTQMVQISSIPDLILSDEFYVNQQGNFKIKLPKGWTLSPDFKSDSVRVDVNSDADPGSSMTIVSAVNKDKLDIKKATESILDSQILLPMKDDLKVVETKREQIKVANQDALWVELTGVYQEIDMKIIIMFTVNENDIQVVNFTSNEPYVSQNISVIKDSMLSLTPTVK